MVKLSVLVCEVGVPTTLIFVRHSQIRVSSIFSKCRKRLLGEVFKFISFKLISKSFPSLIISVAVYLAKALSIIDQLRLKQITQTAPACITNCFL